MIDRVAQLEWPTPLGAYRVRFDWGDDPGVVPLTSPPSRG
jgi:hypothetical protein